jgi:hypothetical protein
MPGLRRPTPAKHVLDLTRRLAEEYDAIPLPEVSRIVQDAVSATTGPNGKWDGTPEGIPAIVEVIEILAREDLDAPTRTQPAVVTPAPAAPAPRAARRSGRRRGAA